MNLDNETIAKELAVYIALRHPDLNLSPTQLRDSIQDGLAEMLTVGAEPPEPDGECFRGGEAAAELAESQARIQQELK